MPPTPLNTSKGTWGICSVVLDPVGTIEFAASSSRTALGLDPADLERRNIFDFVTGPGRAS